VPPAAASFCEYAMAASPVGSGDGVVMVRDATMVSVSFWLAVTPVASVNWTVKLDVPVALGFPAIAPAVDSDSPLGRLPLATAQV
jgi:hypothetical protein